MIDDQPPSKKEPRAVAARLKMEIIEAIELDQVPRGAIEEIPYTFAKKHLILPLAMEESEMVVAVADPLDLEAIEELRFIFDQRIRTVYCPDNILQEAIQHCYRQESGATSRFLEKMGEKKNSAGEEEVEVYDLLEERGERSPVVRLLNLILAEAIEQGASDVHFEPFQEGLRVRYRIDGLLQNRHAPKRDVQRTLLTRIKVMARLDIAEHRLPQDGRIRLKLGQREVDFRVSTVPVIGGERIVLRILDKGNLALGLEKIGMESALLTSFRRLIRLPEGIVLVTGPTGSGKTTTLYSALSEIYSEESNIMTIEDPVEYNLRGIAQMATHHKINLDFARGLRHILRQDPDVIMVGEIRDRETAEIAIQAALTGHLVLSTLHTNDAPSAVTRLVDMGIEPYLLSSSLIGVLAQRLVRKICPHCKERIEIDEEELSFLKMEPAFWRGAHFCKGIGCSHCYQSGFSGRIGIYELMVIDQEIAQMICKTQESQRLREIALRKGMVHLKNSGALLVKEGTTTIDEIVRVVRAAVE